MMRITRLWSDDPLTLHCQGTSDHIDVVIWWIWRTQRNINRRVAITPKRWSIFSSRVGSFIAVCSGLHLSRPNSGQPKPIAKDSHSSIHCGLMYVSNHTRTNTSGGAKCHVNFTVKTTYGVSIHPSRHGLQMHSSIVSCVAAMQRGFETPPPETYSPPVFRVSVLWSCSGLYIH